MCGFNIKEWEKLNDFDSTNNHKRSYKLCAEVAAKCINYTGDKIQTTLTLFDDMTQKVFVYGYSRLMNKHYLSSYYIPMCVVNLIYMYYPKEDRFCNNFNLKQFEYTKYFDRFGNIIDRRLSL